MSTTIFGFRSFRGSSTWASSSSSVHSNIMCRLVLLFAVLTINIKASSQIPPRLASCRDIYKARGAEDYVFPTGASCGVTLSFPLATGVVRNITDPRNCENHYTCKGYTCQQCPCPPGETFNPRTLECDNTNTPCVCPTTTTTTVATTTTVEPTTTQPPYVHNAGLEKPNKDNDGSDKQNGDTNSKPVSSEVIIIAGIVSATVIVIVVIVMGVFCWQRRHNARLNARVSKPPMSSSRKLSSTPPQPVEQPYSTSVAPTEKHEYAEIDERMINGRKHWQHGGSMRAPPLPNHQPPPTSPTFIPTCPHHHTRSDSGLGSADTSFTANYPRRTFQPINPAHSIKIGVAYNERPNAGICQNCEEPYHNQEDSSASTDSQYSNSSHATISVDSRDVDMRTPLHAGNQNYVSKQVYI